MAIRQLDKSAWTGYFNWLSDLLIGKRAEIEVASLKIGDQIEAEWLPIVGIAYDHKDDIIEITLDDPDHHVDHLVHSPREIYVDDSAAILVNMEIVDAGGVRQIINLRDPLMLPPASETAA